MTMKDLTALEEMLLLELPGFSVSGRLMLLPPLEHVLRAIYFESSSYDKTAFTVTVFVMPLCVPTEHLSFNFGTRVRHKGGGDRWTMGMSDLVKELSTAIKDQAVPFLSRVKSLLDFVEVASSFSGNPHTPKAIAFALARAGQDRRAIAVLDELLNKLDLSVPWQQAIASQAETLKIKLIANPSEAHRQLEDWEVETVRKLGLEQFL